MIIICRPTTVLAREHVGLRQTFPQLYNGDMIRRSARAEHAHALSLAFTWHAEVLRYAGALFVLEKFGYSLHDCIEWTLQQWPYA